MKTTKENNKLIDEFMESRAEYSKYHTSWDWLMPVVEKIYGLELENELVLIVRDALADASLIGTYDAVVDFINWYNEENHTYDVVFNDDTSTNHKGFALPKQEAIDYIQANNGTDYSYFADYKGGVVSVVCNETHEEVYTEIVK